MKDLRILSIHLLQQYLNHNLVHHILTVYAPLQFIGSIEFSHQNNRVVQILPYDQFALVVLRNGRLITVNMKNGQIVKETSFNDEIHQVCIHPSRKWITVTGWQSRTYLSIYELLNTKPFIIKRKGWRLNNAIIQYTLLSDASWGLVKCINEFVFFHFNLASLDLCGEWHTCPLPYCCLFTSISEQKLWCQCLTNQQNPTHVLEKYEYRPKLQSLQKQTNIQIHSCCSRIRLLQQTHDYLIAVCVNRSIYVWQKQPNQIYHLVKRFNKHTQTIQSISIRFPYFVSCSLDKTIRFYDLKQRQELYKHQRSTTKQPFSLEWLDNRLCIGYSNAVLDICSLDC